jgi:hypothetical protein
MIVIRENGSSEVLEGSRHLALDALQAAVGGYIEIVAFTDGSAFVVNEEGLLHGMRPNIAASLIAASKGRRVALVGPVAFLTAAEVRSMEDDDA